jgi:hypothetical protein
MAKDNKPKDVTKTAKYSVAKGRPIQPRNMTDEEYKLAVTSKRRELGLKPEQQINILALVKDDLKPDISSTPTLDTRKERRGARQSQALAYNTLPKSLNKQASIFDILNQDQAIRKEIITNNLNTIGAELSVPEQRALGATLELLHNTGAYRRADEQLEAGQRVTSEELVVPLQDYLKAYGLDKTINSRGWTDYPRQQATDAIDGLKGLTKPVMQVWGLKNGGGRFKYAERTYGGLISSVTEVYYDPSEKAYKELLDGDTSVAIGAKFIRITPSKIFYTRPFIRYPRQLITELQTHLKGSKQRLTTTALNIVNMLNLEAYNGRDEIVRDYGTMIAQAGQNKAIEGGKGKYRRYTRAEGRIQQALDQTKAIGAVTEHKLEIDPIKGKQYRVKIDRKAFTDEDGADDKNLAKPNKKPSK